MGVLTNDMTRLRNEVSALRNKREEGASELRETVDFMRSSIRGEQSRAARKDRAARADFVTDLTTEVKNMKGHFRKSFARMAKEGCASRKNFVKQSKEVVHGLLNAVAADLTGAHRAWFGVAKAKVHPVKIVVEHEIKPQPKAEVKVEAPRHEIKPQPKVEVKVEAPRHEIKPQPKVEVKVEAPRHEIKPEVKPHGVAPKAEAQKQQTFQASGPRQIFTHGKRNKK